MGNYLRAESLKMKRTFTKKLIILMPMACLLFGALSPAWYEANSFNWWYMMILPGYVALACFMVHQQEDKRLKYFAVMSLPVDLKKVWISKILLIGNYVFLSCMMLFAGILPGRFMFPLAIASPMPVAKVFAGALVIAVTSLWQIPFCLFLSKKAGLFPTMLINGGAGIVLDILAMDKGLWWICPYSITTRLMCPMLGILPNGMLAEKGDPLLNPNVILPGVAMSILLFVVLTVLTAGWFAKQEVK